MIKEIFVHPTGEKLVLGDEQLLREARDALIAAARVLKAEAKRLHDNVEPVQELRVLQVLNPARVAITKLEERLLRE